MDLFLQVPTAVLGVLIIVLTVLCALAGATLVQRRVPADKRKSQSTRLQQIGAGLGAMFSVIVGFSAFLVLYKYHAAQLTVQSEAGDLEEITGSPDRFLNTSENRSRVWSSLMRAWW